MQTCHKEHQKGADTKMYKMLVGICISICCFIFCCSLFVSYRYIFLYVFTLKILMPNTFNNNIIIQIIIRSTHCTWSRSRCHFLIAFRPRSNIGTDKSVAQSGAKLRNMHSLHNSNSIVQQQSVHLEFGRSRVLIHPRSSHTKH